MSPARPMVARLESSQSFYRLDNSGSTAQMNVRAYDANGNEIPLSRGDLDYLSSNPEAVSVSDTGLLTAERNSGSSTITVTDPQSGVSITVPTKVEEAGGGGRGGSGGSSNNDGDGDGDDNDDGVLVPYDATGENLRAAIAAAQPGDTLIVENGVYQLTSPILVDKDITVSGQSLGTIFQSAVSGDYTGRQFTLSSSGATLRQITIRQLEKTGPEGLIYLGADNLTVEDMNISGQYVGGDGEVSRAMVGQAGITGFLIQDNVIYNLRQPAYLSGATGLSGSILENQVYGTRGWVVEGAQINFMGNTWRTDDRPGTSQNFGCDIALLNESLSPNPAAYYAFYGDTTALEANNTGDLLAVEGPGMGSCDQRSATPPVSPSPSPDPALPEILIP